jgi:hypothetical protein
MAKMLIVGNGEIGSALGKVLSRAHDVDIFDVGLGTDWACQDVMNICYPYGEGFVDSVLEYRREYTPRCTIIHSTVPVGTSRACGAMHSPVMGMHPHLEKSLLTFTKFFGGDADGIYADMFRQAGMDVYLFDEPETTELMKLLSTLFYGTCIEFVKDVKRQCDGLGVPFDAWAIWTQAYNRGYGALGADRYTRPQLAPIMKRIGGHCVLQNCELMDDNDFAKLIERRNQ